MKIEKPWPIAEHSGILYFITSSQDFCKHVAQISPQRRREPELSRKENDRSEPIPRRIVGGRGCKAITALFGDSEPQLILFRNTHFIPGATLIVLVAGNWAGRRYDLTE